MRLMPIIANLKNLENELNEACKKRIVDSYTAHRDELMALPCLPTGVVIAGENWSYAAQSLLTKVDLSHRGIKDADKKIRSLQYMVQLDQCVPPPFEVIAHTHMGIPLTLDFPPFRSRYLQPGGFLGIVLIGDARLREAEEYVRDWHARNAAAGHKVGTNKVLFLYDSQMHDKGLISLYK